MICRQLKFKLLQVVIYIGNESKEIAWNKFFIVVFSRYGAGARHLESRRSDLSMLLFQCKMERVKRPLFLLIAITEVIGLILILFVIGSLASVLLVLLLRVIGLPHHLV